MSVYLENGGECIPLDIWVNFYQPTQHRIPENGTLQDTGRSLQYTSVSPGIHILQTINENGKIR
jgi:hypothetical protein